MIHEVLGLTGPAQPYSTREEAARALLPPGFEWMLVMHSAKSVYAPCRRTSVDGEELSFPHHGTMGPDHPAIPVRWRTASMGDAGTVNPADDPSLVTLA